MIMIAKRRNLLLGAAAGALAVAVCAALVLRVRSAVPRVEVESTTYSFSGADTNAEVHCTFRIRNAGRAPLSLKNVRADCTCTQARVDKDLLAAGESTIVRAVYHTPERVGGSGANISIETNDPGQPKVFVRVEGTVRPVLQLVPAILYLEGVGDPAEAATPPDTAPGAAPSIPTALARSRMPAGRPAGGRAAAVFAWGERPVEIEQVKASADWLEATFVPEPTARAAAEKLGQIVVRPRGAPRGGDGKAEVYVTARSGNQVLRRTLKILVDVRNP